MNKKYLKISLMKYIKSLPVILIIGLVIAGCTSRSNTAEGTDTSAASADTAKAIPVKILILTKAKIARTIDYTATVLPYEEVNMVPSTPGRIDRLYVEVGDRIKKGDRLFLMDRTQLYQMELQLSSLSKDLSRLDTLLKTGSTKQQAYDQMKTQYDVTKTNVDFMTENTLLKAPFNGVVTGKYFENGEMYSGAPTTSTGRAAVVTVMQVDPLKINVNISEQYYPQIKKGMSATVTADVYSGEVFTGRVSLVSPTINPATRSFLVEIELQNRNNLLKPGMFVRVSMDLGEVETYVVPASTVLVQEGTNIRFVFVDSANIAKRIEVNPGKRFDDQLEIISDYIRQGARLVIEGQAKLIDGDKIEVEN
jgi:membrane fusion protein (multidrug efflux system)